MDYKKKYLKYKKKYINTKNIIGGKKSSYANILGTEININNEGQTVTANNPFGTAPPVVPVLDPNRDTTWSVTPKSVFGIELPENFWENFWGNNMEKATDVETVAAIDPETVEEFREEIKKLNNPHEDEKKIKNWKEVRDLFVKDRDSAKAIIKKKMDEWGFNYEDEVKNIHKYYGEQYVNAQKLNEKLKEKLNNILEQKEHEEHEKQKTVKQIEELQKDLDVLEKTYILGYFAYDDIIEVQERYKR